MTSSPAGNTAALRTAPGAPTAHAQSTTRPQSRSSPRAPHQQWTRDSVTAQQLPLRTNAPHGLVVWRATCLTSEVRLIDRGDVIRHGVDGPGEHAPRRHGAPRRCAGACRSRWRVRRLRRTTAGGSASAVPPSWPVASGAWALMPQGGSRRRPTRAIGCHGTGTA